MLKFIKSFFGGRKTEETQPEAAPYKTEAPLVQLGPEPTPIATQATQAVVESIAPAKKPRAKKPAGEKKPRSKKPKA